MSTTDDPTKAASSRIAQMGVPMLIVGVIMMMVIPLPPVLLDMLLAMNLSIAVVVMMTSMMVARALDFSVFPALLLVTTLFRLSLNISSTRLILSDGEAGKVIEAFGNVVIGGNLVIGLVIFLILVVIQFVVITNGAGRVAEVAARFTLDAMPGKQMAIDADLNSGLITDAEARQRRSDVSREADFYGAMDGASKFVKGDAIAGIVIVLVNLLGGFLIGVMQNGMSLGEAISRYALLSIGDGLVSQVPALLISVASGLVVTRVQSDHKTGLGGDITRQLFGSPRPLRIGAAAVLLMGLMPGMPLLPFLVIGAVLLVSATRASATEKRLALAGETAAALPPGSAAGATAAAEGDGPEIMMEQIRMEPLELELAPDLLDLLDTTRGGGLMDRVKSLRKRIASDLGLVVPPIRTRDAVTSPPSTYVIRVHGVEAARGEAPPGCSLVLGEHSHGLSGKRTIDPVFGLPAVWVSTDIADVLAAEGATVVDRASVVVTHLSEVVRTRAADLLTRQDVQVLVDAVKEISPVVAAEVGNDGLTLAEVQRVLRELLGEGVPIRDLTRILEAVTARARDTRAPEQLVEAARGALGPSISTAASVGGRMAALTFEPLLEQALLESARTGDNGSWLALDPMRMEALITGVGDAVREAEQSGHRPALLCSAQIRPAVRRLVAPGRPDLPVLAYTELARNLTVEPVGVIHLGSTVPA